MLVNQHCVNKPRNDPKTVKSGRTGPAGGGDEKILRVSAHTLTSKGKEIARRRSIVFEILSHNMREMRIPNEEVVL